MILSNAFVRWLMVDIFLGSGSRITNHDGCRDGVADVRTRSLRKHDMLDPEFKDFQSTLGSGYSGGKFGI